MYKVFQMPVDHRQLTDNEFWQRVDQIEELSKNFEQGIGAFALSINTGESDFDFPYIRFARMYPRKSS